MFSIHLCAESEVMVMKLQRKRGDMWAREEVSGQGEGRRYAGRNPQ